MEFLNLQGNNRLRQTLSELEEQNRMPHAVIIEGGSEETRAQLADVLSAWAVCTSDVKPCGECKNCLNALEHAHSDIYFAKGEGKTDIFKKNEIARIIEDAAIKPNQASRKVYVFTECDRRFPAVSQNAFLKTLEEPPQDIMFLMTCESSRCFLETIRSRAVTLTMESDEKPDGETLSLAREIVGSIVGTSELGLMRALNKLTDRFQAFETLNLVTALLMDGLAVYVGASAGLDNATAELLCKKLTRLKFLELIEATKKAQTYINQNVGIKLTGVWLCGEYRRILWQR